MLSIEQAKVLAQIILDYADNNLNKWESFADETPAKAEEIYQAAKKLVEVFNNA